MTKVLFSHSSRNKPLLRELRSHLPKHLDVWIDEDRLLLGTNLQETLEHAVSEESDFVVLFVDEAARLSKWVQREVTWALGVENALGRTILLPIVLEADAWEKFKPEELRSRFYLTLREYSPEAVHQLANHLSTQLFALVCRDLDRVRQEVSDSSALAATMPNVLHDADTLMKTAAAQVRRTVLQHRWGNPLSIDELLPEVRNYPHLGVTNLMSLTTLLGRLQRNGMLEGVYVDEDVIYTESRNYAARTEEYQEEKKRIARACMRQLSSGDTITLDSGSTTTAIARQLGRELAAGRLRRITVITNSIPAAGELLAAPVDPGPDDENANLRILLAGGRIRHNTHAIVAANPDKQENSIQDLVDAVPTVNVSIVGTSGISENGFTTGSAHEAWVKKCLLIEGSRKFVVTDPSKLTMKQDHLFAGLDKITVITSGVSEDDARLQELRAQLGEAGGHIILA